jgi:cytochrome c-type biogenesis protein CcsB
MVSIPGMGWPFLIVLVLGAATLVLNLVERPQEGRGWVRRLFLAVVLVQALALAFLLVKVASGPYFVPAYGQSFGVHLASSPFLLAGLATALFASLAWLVLKWKYDTIVAFLPQREMLDALIYKTVAISFPLLTLMIITGAYWANRTWGSYWSWDPKEDWALITWLTYAGYLHMRLTRGWRGRRSAYFAIIGFAIVLFTFFGVTYLLPGLHSYG